jgi:hypothetical protein
LDVTGLCSSLVEVQQLLEQHWASTAALQHNIDRFDGKKK